MEIFLDTSKTAQIERWLAHGVIDGVTTNPSIMLKDGLRDLEGGAQRFLIEYDRSPPTRAAGHSRGILERDPTAIVNSCL